MTSAADEACSALKAWSVRVRKGDALELMDAIVSRAAEAGVDVLVLDGEMVFGKDHLRCALYHAVRAAEQGTNSSESRAMETLLYASGERQLSAAIKKMSVSSETEEAVVARLGDGAFEPEPAWTPLPERPSAPARSRLLKFGISARELGTVDERRASELVLERVAAVEIMKR